MREAIKMVLLANSQPKFYKDLAIQEQVLDELVDGYNNFDGTINEYIDFKLSI
ncbi:hypothetical protein R0K30_02240 [Bacillus sp. SIMBA_154]|uniref:hypothetical protein n=1 Tax=Bacillus sp. SIMBA_154 TaxID=3080859 RepID=UPI0039789CC6